jgi:hypothetical protein
MTIKTNILKPELLSSHEVDFGSSIAQSIWAKIGNFHNWTNTNIPVGFLMFFHGSQTLADSTPIELPNPNLWVLCDGQQIVDADSPINGQFTPDLRKVFIKGASVSGNTGGAETVNLSHNHGNTLVNENDESGTSNARTGGDYRAGSNHTHSVDTQWSSAEPILPPYRDLQIYLRKK